MIAENAVFSWEGKLFRLLKILGEKAALFCVKPLGKNYELVESHTLTEAFNKGELQEVPDPFQTMRTLPLTGKIGERAKRNYEEIQDALQPHLLFDKEEMRKTIREICSQPRPQLDEKNPRPPLSLVQIKRWLLCWWEKGQTVGALRPKYGQSKGHRHYKTTTGRSSSGKKAPIIDDYMRQKMNRACRKYLFGDNRISVPQAHARFLLDLNLQASDPKAPTLVQFRYYFKTAFSAKERSIASVSAREYAKDTRPSLGTAASTVSGIGAVYEVDSTQMDFYLASERIPGCPVGRPTLYVVADRYSGLITGFHVTLNPPSFRTVTDALFNAFIPKSEFRKKYGISNELGDWEAQGIPSTVVADNAELQSEQGRHFQRLLEISVQLTGTRRGDQKGTVEKALDLLMDEIAPEMVAKVDPIKLSKKAGGVDRSREAVLDLSHLRQIIYDAVLIVNKRLRDERPPYYPLNRWETPEKIWSWCKDHGLSSLKTIGDQKKLRFALMNRFPATISREGFKAEGVLYACKRAEQEGYFERGKEKVRKNGQLCIDASNISKALFIPDPENQPDVAWDCILSEKNKYLENLTLAEAKSAIQQVRKNEKEAQLAQTNLRIKAIQNRREIMKACSQKDPAGEKMSANRREKLQQEQVKDEAAHPRLELPSKKQASKPSEKKKPGKFDLPTSIDEMPE